MADENKSNSNSFLSHNINYNSADNNFIIDFNSKLLTPYSSNETPILTEGANDLERWKHKFNYYTKPIQADKSKTLPYNSSPTPKTSVNIKECKSVQLTPHQPYRSASPLEIHENSIVKTENGYEIYFVENSLSNKNKTSSHIDDATAKEDINTEEIISQNYGLKEAIKNNEDTYNSLEQEFMFNTNNNPYSLNSKNNFASNKDLNNNNQLLLNLSDNNNYLNSLSQHNILNENSINGNYKDKDNTYGNNIIINFNNYNHQVSGQDLDNSNMRRMNSNNLSMENMSMYSRQNSKLVLKKIFQHNPVCNLSTRLINDEKNQNSNSRVIINDVVDYRFIDNVNQNAHINRINQVKNMISMMRYISLKKEVMLLMIQFNYEDIEEIKNSYEIIKTKINATLAYYYYPIVEQFKSVYLNELELYEYYFETNKKKLGHSSVSLSVFKAKYPPKTKYISLDLYIKARIMNQTINQTVAINFTFNASKTKSNEDKMILTWKFDLIKKDKINFWIASEGEDYEGRINRFSYIQPIMSYAPGDFISIKIPLLFKGDSLDQKTVTWLPLKYTSFNPDMANFLFYEKSVYYNTNASMMKKFDKMRYCELETLIHLWKNQQSLSNRKTIDELKRILHIGDLFNEISFEYDIRKLYIFKVKLKAVNIGIVKRNKYFNFDIVIKESKASITNETQCLGLLNSVNTQYEMRMGEILIFYLTEIYG